MGLTKEQKHATVHQEALVQFDRIMTACRSEREQCLRDRRFCDIAGAQWEGSLGQQFKNKPKFEVNKIQLNVQRIINEYRNNRISVDFVSRDGDKNDDIADVCDGLYRADEADSVANEAKDNAFEEGVKGGFGAWRLRACYEDEYDEDNMQQRIRIEPIFEADSTVFFDVDAKRYDKADAKHCFVLVPMTPEGYRAEYDDDPNGWTREIESGGFDWSTPDIVYVAEYYKVEDAGVTFVHFQSPTGDTKKLVLSELDEEDWDELTATGWVETARKRKKVRKVRKYMMSGGGILEDCGYIAGDQIPIVPFFGKRSVVDGIERCVGHVRPAKDAQRLKNMQLSKLGEISAYSSIEKPILTAEQISGHQVMWQDDNIKQYPYLLINPVTDPAGQQVIAGPVGYTKPPQVPQALAALLQITEADMAELLGSRGEADKIVSNISGKAVELIQSRLDMQTYIYMSNLAKSEGRAGEIWLSMMRDVYVEESRKMKTIGVNGEVGQVEVNRPSVNDNGEEVYGNDLASAKLGVFVEVGPSFNSQRDAMARSLTSLLAVTNDPETAQIIQSMLIMQMEGEGLNDIREFFRRRLVMVGAIKPTEEEKKELAVAQAGKGQDPNTVLALAMAQEASAKANKAEAEVLETLANTELTRAKTVETVSKVQSEQRDQAMTQISRIMQQYGIRPAELGEYREQL